MALISRTVDHRAPARIALALLLLMGAAALAVPAVAEHGDPSTIDFEVAPGVYTTQLSNRGVTFPGGIEVFKCNTAQCGSGTARSGANAVRTELFGEFAYEPFEVRLSSPQHTVRVYVRHRGGGQAGETIQATMRGFNEDDDVVVTRNLTFEETATWQLLSISRCSSPTKGSTSCIDDVVRVVVTARYPGDPFDSNWLIYDDLTIDVPRSPSSSSPSADTSAPVVAVEDPFEAETETDRTLDVRARVEEDRDLRIVTGDVIHRGSGAVVAQTEFCGTSNTSACPIAPPSPVVFRQAHQVLIPGSAENGAYVFRVRACDGAGNCSTDEVGFSLDVAPPQEATRVVATRLEINQGIQNVLSSVEGRGHIWPVGTGVRLVPGKNAVVRYYVFGVDGASTGYSAALQLRGERRDGSTFSTRIQPNAGGAVALIERPDAADEREALLDMRVDPAKTLNFVIPARTLDGVRLFDMQLRGPTGPVTGWAQVRLSPPTRIGFNVVRLTGDPVDNGTPPGSVERNILDYMRVAYPVTEARIVSDRGLTVAPDLILLPLMGECNYTLWYLWGSYGTDDAPVRRFTSDPSVLPTMGIVRYGAMDGAFGCAYREGDPFTSVRIGGTLVTETWGDTAAHEVGHVTGLRHASNAHSEGSGGDVEGWEYPHGTIGNDSFGVIPQVQTPPIDGDHGQWEIKVIDPCPLPVDQRLTTCPVNASNDTQMVHELMSYGQSNTDLTPLVANPARNRWISPTTYNRIHTHICGRACSSSGARRETASARAADGDGHSDAERVDALLLDGVVRADGTIELLPLIRKEMPRALVRDSDEGGDYTVELRDSSGETLYRRTVSLGSIEGDGTTHLDVVHEVLPFRRGTNQVVVRAGDEIVATKTGTPAAPVVEISSPGGGDVLAGGTQTVRWSATDPDGDPVWSLVQYSPDGGWSWQGIRLVPPGAGQEAELVVDEMIPGRFGIVRVTASDGLNTTVAQTEFLSVGTKEDPANRAAASRTISLSLRKHLRGRGRVRSPEGPASCHERARVIVTRNGRRVAATRTRADGRYSVRIGDRPGSYEAVVRPEDRALIRCRGARSKTTRHRH